MKQKLRAYKQMSTAVVLAVIATVFLAGCDDKQVEFSEKKAEEKVIQQTPKVQRPPRVKLVTSKGAIIIELNANNAPVTVKNFLRYANEGFYDGTIFHRVISGFMIQGGGFTADMRKKQTHEQITNEASNGLKNSRGTITMARMPNPDSATSQFFINHRDNSNLDYVQGRNPGYAVFGKVVDGMDVVDAIAAVKTATKGRYENVPVKPVMIKTVKVISEE